MKKILLTILLLIATPTFAENTNMEIKIYERFIDAKNYNYLGSTSIWKYNNDYKNALLNSLNSTTPIKTIVINK